MRIKRINIDLNIKDYEDIHNLMNLTLQSEDGITVYRVHPDNKKQPFYRKVIQEGVKSIYAQFLKEKEKLQNES